MLFIIIHAYLFIYLCLFVRYVRMVLVFLDNESLYASITAKTSRLTLKELDITIDQLEKNRVICKNVITTPSVMTDILDKIESDTLPLSEANVLGVCLGLETLKLQGQKYHHILEERVVGVFQESLQEKIKLREKTLDLEVRVMRAFRSNVEEECGDMEGFEEQRVGCEESTRMLREALLNQRRQRALQRCEREV